MIRITTVLNFVLVAMFSLLFSNQGFAQQCTIGFAASGDTTAVGSVEVQNLTKGTSVTVPEGHALNVNVVSTAVDGLNADPSAVRVSQQGSTGESTISFYAKKSAPVLVDVYTMDGKKMIGQSFKVESGENSIELTLPAGSYAINLSGAIAYSTKLQSQANTAQQAVAKLLGNNVQAKTPNFSKAPVSGMSEITMDCCKGDKMRFIATSGTYKAVVNNVAGDSKTVNFIFIATATIPAGTFVMGSPLTEVERNADEIQHTVTLSPFRMSKKEVTNAQFADFLNAKGVDEFGVWDTAPTYRGQVLVVESNAPGAIMYADYGLRYLNSKWVPVAGYENYPIIYISWYGAAEYAAYVGGKLPTEAQWEYACRAGTTTTFNTGDFLTNLQANYDWAFPYNGGVNNVKLGPGLNSPVGSYAPNAFGLFDMHGNNNEWCSDWYGPYSTLASTDPTGPATGTLRVVRSGNFRRHASSSRSAVRNTGSPDFVGVGTGVRVAFEP